MERAVGENNRLYVFSFVTSTGANGLDDRTKSIIVPVLHDMVSINCIELLKAEYQKETPQETQEAATQADKEAASEVKISAEQEMDPEIAALYVEAEKEKTEESEESEDTAKTEEEKE